jgi:hypothetical protein
MAISRQRIVQFVLATFLVVNDGIACTLAERPGFPRLNRRATHADFAEKALSLPSVAAHFMDAHEESARIRLIHEAEELLQEYEPSDGKWVRLRWPSRAVAPFPKPSQSNSPRRGQRTLLALDKVLAPEKVQELLQDTKDRREAIALLRNALGLQISERAIDAYFRRHALRFEWQNAGWRVDPQRVQDLVRNTRSRAEAAEVLQKALGWPEHLSNLGGYLRRHGLTAPWQIRSMHIDPQKVQVLIQNTHNRAEAVEVLRTAFAGRFHPDELSRYLRRHGLIAPWQHKRDAVHTVALRGGMSKRSS